MCRDLRSHTCMSTAAKGDGICCHFMSRGNRPISLSCNGNKGGCKRYSFRCCRGSLGTNSARVIGNRACCVLMSGTFELPLNGGLCISLGFSGPSSTVV